jgi:hypothetical protein
MGASSNEWHMIGVSDNLRQILMQINPHRKEIAGLINILNKMGANFKLIAACLNLQGWNNYYGNGEWTEKDVKENLAG